MQLTVTEALGGLPQRLCLAGCQHPAGYADPRQRTVVRPVQAQRAGAGVTAAPGTRVARRTGRKGDADMAASIPTVTVADPCGHCDLRDSRRRRGQGGGRLVRTPSPRLLCLAAVRSVRHRRTATWEEAR